MLIICEECAKKYNIDETRIKGKKAQFSCRECGHIIVVEKSEPLKSSPEKQEISDEEAMAQVAAMPSPEHDEDTGSSASVSTAESSSNSSAKGMSSGAYVTLLMGIEFFILSGTFLYLVMMYLPGIIKNKQTTDAIMEALILPFPLKLIGAAFLLGLIVPVLLALLRLKKC